LSIRCSGLPISIRTAWALSIVTLLTACGHRQQARVQVPSPPPPAATTPAPAPTSPTKPSATTTKSKPETAEEKDEEIVIPADAKPLLTETGTASWYGAPYHNRKSSNGEVYNMHAMTAAHLTFPLGSIVRVTNLKTNHMALVRITDRGPFVEGRVLDLSYAAAKKLDVWQPGLAQVKLELMQAPEPLTGGRWAVQFGSFEDQKDATRLADHLSRRYQTAKINKFVSPVGVWWVRVRVLNDDRQRAEALVHETQVTQGAAYLVRLD
jgi:peptidoglycan lytic transglycosylase